MTATLAELESRVDTLEAEVRGEKGLGDQRRALTTMLRLLEDTRERVSKVEIRLEGISHALGVLTANQAEMRGELRAEIKAVQDNVTKLDAKVTNLDSRFTVFQTGLPSMIAETMREVLREQKG